MSESIFEKNGLWPVLVVWLACILVALFYRGALPIDETRYLSVAWEMWERGDMLVPYFNGTPYAHKPPLLFWIINFSWLLFGVSEWSARLAVALVGLVSLLLVYPLARLLWPSDKKVAVLAAWILLTILVWAVWSGMLMFDLLLAACAQAGWIGILLAWRRRTIAGWLLTGLAIGLGILAKGPVILLLVLPVALLAPFWINRFHSQKVHSPSWPVWYGGICMALLVGSVIALAWALPAANAGGEAYRDAILWGQTANRMVKSFAHSRPWWWYLPLLPLLLYPWSFWAPLWRQCIEHLRADRDSGNRFVLTVFIAGLVLFSLISGKQIHYLLPLFPALALFAAHVLSKSCITTPISRTAAIALTSLPAVVGLYIIAAPYIEHSPKLPESLANPPVLWSIPFLGLLFVALSKPTWFSRPSGVGVLSVLVFMFCYGAFLHPMSQDYDLKPMARKIAQQQSLGKLVGFTGRDYKGEFNFYGRLRQPLRIIPDGQEPHWRHAHANSAMIKIVRERPSHDSLFIPVWNKGAYYLWVPPGESN